MALGNSHLAGAYGLHNKGVKGALKDDEAIAVAADKAALTDTITDVGNTETGSSAGEGEEKKEKGGGEEGEKDGKEEDQDEVVASLDEPVKQALTESLGNMSGYLRAESAKAGGWRMGLYRLDGSMDLDMSVDDWSDAEKVLILNEKVLYMKTEKQKAQERHGQLFKKLKEERAVADSEYDKAKDLYDALQKEYGAKGLGEYKIYKVIYLQMLAFLWVVGAFWT